MTELSPATIASLTTAYMAQQAELLARQEGLSDEERVRRLKEIAQSAERILIDTIKNSRPVRVLETFKHLWENPENYGWQGVKKRGI